MRRAEGKDSLYMPCRGRQALGGYRLQNTTAFVVKTALYFASSVLLETDQLVCESIKDEEERRTASYSKHLDSFILLFVS